MTRLSTSDAAFYHQENTATPLYVGSLAILRRPRGGLSYETLLATVESRLPQIPRYRQKVREVTLGLARPVWIDDPDFDITYHVRRSALPSPGSDAQLHDLVSRLAGRPLDRTRPLWEMYLIEGVAGNRLALFIKSHQALINGMTACEIGHVIADRTRRPPEIGEDIWLPAREPSAGELLRDAVSDWLARPGQELRALGSTVAEVATNTGELAQLTRRAADVVRTVARGSAPTSATSQFFFNVQSNPALDGNYAVFGNVVGAAGLAAIDAIGAVPVYDASVQLGAAFTELPLLNPSLDSTNVVLVQSVNVVPEPTTLALAIAGLTAAAAYRRRR